MSEKRTNISKLAMYYGVIHHADKLGKITNLETNEQDDRFLIIKAEDFPGSNAFNVLSSSYPILAHEEISYIGQPLFAVFGSDYESIKRISSSINYTTAPSSNDNLLFDKIEIPPEILEWGNITEVIGKGDLKEVKSDIELKTRESARKTVITCTAWQEDNVLNVELPCQWPALVREAISKATLFPHSSIIIHNLDYFAPLDEYMIAPTILGALAATACLKLSAPIQIKENITVYSPISKIKRSTYCNNEGKPIAEKVEMSIDQGAFPILEKEMLTQAMTGLIPNYPLQAFFAKVNIISSANPPAAFFGSLGLSDAITSTQIHTNRISKAFKENPISFQKLFSNEKSRFTDYIPSVELSDTYNLALSLEKKASFLRKWGSYNTQNGDLSLIHFSRGIAIANNVGISGFSTSFAKNNNFQIKLTLTEKNSLVITTSFNTKNKFAELCALLIKKELNLLEDSQIIYQDFAENRIDTGPDTLSTKYGQIPQQIIEGCQNLLLSKEPKPLSLTINSQDIYYPCEFQNQGLASVIVETFINATTLLPVVTKVYASLIYGKVLNLNLLKCQIKTLISETLMNCGAKLSDNPSNPYTIDLNIKTNQNDYIYTLDTTIKGLVQAAFNTAISDAIGKEINTLPVSPQLLLELKNLKNEDAK